MTPLQEIAALYKEQHDPDNNYAPGVMLDADYRGKSLCDEGQERTE